jgi:hypothetical protein
LNSWRELFFRHRRQRPRRNSRRQSLNAAKRAAAKRTRTVPFAPASGPRQATKDKWFIFTFWLFFTGYSSLVILHLTC